MKKNIKAFFLAVIFIFSASAANAECIIDKQSYKNSQEYVMSQSISVFLNNEPISFPDQLPVIVNDRTMVPMRPIFEAFGAELEWNADEQSVHAFLENTVIELTIGYYDMSVNNTIVSLDTAPFIENGRTMVPLRAISEAFNANVRWESSPPTVAITTGTYTPSQTQQPAITPAPQNSMQKFGDSQPDESVQYPEVEVFNAVNELRTKNGLTPLIWSNSLAAVARAHSYDMASLGYFAHNSLDGRTPAERIKNAGISYRRMAENIAAGQDTAAAVFESWMESEGHKQNMLDPELTHLGVGLAASDNSQYKFYWTQCFTGSASASTVDISSMEHKVLDLVNTERVNNGLNPLVWNEQLAEVARAHSYDMAARNFFDHNNPDGLSPFERIANYGIQYSVAAENIAEGQSSPEAVMQAWMNSPGHRENILNPSLTELGVGLYVSEYGYGYYWTQNFRRPLDSIKVF